MKPRRLSFGGIRLGQIDIVLSIRNIAFSKEFLMNRILFALALIFAFHAPQVLSQEKGAEPGKPGLNRKHGPLKVFILAGQSNMQGHANTSTFDYIGKDPVTAPLLAAMRDGEGKPRICEKVWISSLGCGGNQYSDMLEKTGKLTAGFGASDSKIGPEFTFGIYTEKMLKEPVLIIKTSWGGRSLNTDFRPPSAGEYKLPKAVQAVWDQHPQGAHGIPKLEDRKKWKEDKDAATGVFYRAMIEHVKKVTKDIKRVCPEYDEKAGYELAGFVWFQGFNDLVDNKTYPDGNYDEYSRLLAHFIRDVRKDLSAPKMPFVIGVLGVGGDKNVNFRKAMAAPVDMPEFKGNVLAVDTAPFWDKDIDKALANQDAYNKILATAYTLKKDGTLDKEGKWNHYWKPLGTPLPEEQIWRFTTIDATEKKDQMEKRDRRFRDITLPAGMENWYRPDFDDSKWTTGKAPIGKGFLKNWAHTLYDLNFDKFPSRWGAGEFLLMRTTFEVEDLNCDSYRIAGLAIVRQGFHIYLNGQKIHTTNSSADNPRYGAIILGADQIKLLKKGKNVLAAYSNDLYNPRSSENYAAIDLRIEGIAKADKQKLDLALEEVFTPKDRECLKGASNAGYHYFGSAKFFAQIGKAFAEALRFDPVDAAERVPTANLAGFQQSVAPFFEKSCVACHGPKKSKAGLRVDQLDPNLLTGGDIDRWVEIYDVLSQREMPPDDEPDYHLKDGDRAKIVEWLGDEMHKASQARKHAEGHSSFRRMANYEYNHVMQDLLDLNLDFTEALPPENSSEDGFKNSSQYLQMSAAQLNTYREIATEALQKATVEGERPRVVTWQIPMQEAMDKAAALKQKPVRRKNPADTGEIRNAHIINKDTGEGFSYEWAYYVVLDDKSHYGIWNLKPDDNISTLPPVSSVVAVLPPSRQFHLDLGNSVPDEGFLRVRIRVGATERQQGQSANLRLVFGFQTNNEGKMSERIADKDIEVTASTKDPQFLTFKVPLDGLPRNPYRKSHKVGDSPNCTEYLEIHNISSSGNSGEGKPVNLEIDYVEVEAGLYETWPPKSHTAIFFESPNQKDENTYCREILKRFMTRAWRRPIVDEDIAAYQELFAKYRPRFTGFQETMIDVLATVLASPEFLYLVQTNTETPSATPSISDLELANRLSFMLWSSIPDTTLLELAFAGKLKLPGVLDSQIERMLADPKSKRFVRHFVQQWLGFEAIDNLVVDQKKFKVYDEAFKENLLGEPLAFFDHVLRNNRSIMDFLHSDYLIINEPLARHYEIPGVTGQEFRKVPLSPGAERGGLLTTAAVLTMNSTGVDSNPLKRGVWLLERILHDPPPPPPPNVPKVDLTDPRILQMSPKERMADHRNQAACRSCHAKIDPWGLSLENFDAIDRFRTTINDKPVDATAVLYNNQTLDGAVGLKSYLMANRQDQFAKAMVHKFSTYALGRPMSFADRPEIDKMAAELKKRGNGLRDLVFVVIHSSLFSENN